MVGRETGGEGKGSAGDVQVAIRLEGPPCLRQADLLGETVALEEGVAGGGDPQRRPLAIIEGFGGAVQNHGLVLAVADAVDEHVGSPGPVSGKDGEHVRVGHRHGPAGGQHHSHVLGKDGPFGTTIAHGYLTLSLVPYLSNQVFALETPGAKLNYGVNKVRFPNPVRVGSRVRTHVSIAAVDDIPSGKQMLVKHVIEIEGEDKPACVAETVVLLLP